ncbi:MAG TPA: hypothetical protein VFU37_07110 [Pyrinomonadaceae bacterium]|nr:hypothetical protein [Pyrinomonadaceae bacterium]
MNLEPNISEWTAPAPALVRMAALVAVALAFLSIHGPAYAQRVDPRYQTRVSDCRHEPPAGRALLARKADSGISTHGYVAERVLTQTADTRGLTGGEVVICTEYGRVEIFDSDDNQIHLQIRVEGFGEGSDDPVAAAKQVIAETRLYTFLTAYRGRLMVRVWHSTLGFTAPGSQPAFVSVRLQLPPRGAYNVKTEAFHGPVAIRRLTLAQSTLRGNTGDKFKGIPGFIGLTELDNVELTGDVDIDNLLGIPGIRAPVPANMTNLAAAILVKARAGSSCKLKAVTGGNINIVIQPAPDAGVKALGEAKTGQISIGIEGGVAEDLAEDTTFPVRGLISSPDFETKRVKIEVHAASTNGSVNIASLPAAPLVPGRTP